MPRRRVYEVVLSLTEERSLGAFATLTNKTIDEIFADAVLHAVRRHRLVENFLRRIPDHRQPYLAVTLCTRLPCAIAADVDSLCSLHRWAPSAVLRDALVHHFRDRGADQDVHRWRVLCNPFRTRFPVSTRLR